VSVAFVTSAKQQTPGSPCVVTISPTVDDYLIAAYCTDVASGTFTLGSPLTKTFEGTSTSDAMVAAIGAGKAGSGVTSVSTTVSGDAAIGMIATFSGVDTTTPNDATPATTSDSNNNTTGRGLSLTTATNGAMLVYAAALDVGATSDPTVTMSDNAGGLTWTTVYAYESGGFRKLAISYALMPTAGAVTATMTPSIATGFVGVLYALKPSGPSATLDEYSFRFGNDDGNESAHAFAAAENTNVTVSVGSSFLLRALINAALDPASTAFKLRYQKNGSGGYVDVPVGATTVYSTPTWKSAGTAASGTGAVSAGMPSSFSAGDLLFMVVATANQAVATPPSGWTEVSSSPQGTGTAAGTAAARITVYAKIATGSEASTNIGDAGDHTLVNTFAIAGPHQTLASALHVVAGDVASTASTSVTFPGGTTTVNNCLILNIIANATDSATAQGSGWANANLGSVTEQLDFGTTSGNGSGITVISGTLNTAGAIGGTTGTLATSSVQGRITIAIRPPATVTNEIYVATSSNIASGGEATTARLTAPSGKSTSDFVTGRRWDDENGTDAIDLTTDDYTELEWSLNTQSPAAGGDYYDLRVYGGSSALDTYSATPRVTMAGGASNTLTLPQGYVRMNTLLRM